VLTKLAGIPSGAEAVSFQNEFVVFSLMRDDAAHEMGHPDCGRLSHLGTGFLGHPADSLSLLLSLVLPYKDDKAKSR
jgi:hypothetical protein